MLIGNALTLCADKALYLGEIPATGWHRHAAPVLLLGLSGRFRLLLPQGREGDTATNCPTDRPVTPAPSAVIWPDTSCPKIIGSRRRTAPKPPWLK